MFQLTNVHDFEKIAQVYGYTEEFMEIRDNGLSTSTSKNIYDHLIEAVTHRNGSLIPSRREKKVSNVKWGWCIKILSC